MTTITRTIRFGWHTFREENEVACRSCGKKYRRTVSTGFNDMATSQNRADSRARLKAEATALSQKPITCNSCRKGAIVKADALDLVKPATLDAITAIVTEQIAIDK